jgi:hypothetical protein
MNYTVQCPNCDFPTKIQMFVNGQCTNCGNEYWFNTFMSSGQPEWYIDESQIETTHSKFH